MNPDDILVVLAPWTIFTPHWPGSEIITANCGHKCYASKPARDFIAEDPTHVSRCIVCAGDTVNDPDIPNYHVPGSKAEADRILGVAEADQKYAVIRDLFGVQPGEPPLPRRSR